MAEQDKPFAVGLGILGVGVGIAAQVLRATYGLPGSAAGLVLLVAFACVAIPRMRGPVYPTESSFRLRG